MAGSFEGSPASPIFSLRLLGGFTANFCTDPSSALRISSRKGCALLAYVAMRPDQDVGREQLADLLWGDRPTQLARQALRQCLASLRRDLPPRCSEMLVLDGDRVRLNSQLLAVDALEFIELSRSSNFADVERAIGLYGGEFLADLKVNAEPFEEWACAERSRLSGLTAQCLRNCAERMSALGRGQQAIELAERLVALDPLREDWQRLVIRLYATHRGREAALAQARIVSALLKKTLDVSPDSETVALIESIRRGESGQTTDAASRTMEETRPTSDPEARTSIDADEVVPAAHQPVSLQTTSGARLWTRARRWAVASVLAVAVLGGLWFALVRQQTTGPADDQANPAAAAEARASPLPPGLPGPDARAANRATIPIFVLPLATDGGEHEQRIADTISDDLMYRLARFSGLQVISRDTAYLYKGRHPDPALLGAAVGVRYVISGNVTAYGASTRITVELVDTRTRLTVWADRQESDALNIHDVPDEIASRLSRQLQVEATYAKGQDAGPGDESSTASLLAQALAAQYGGQNSTSVQKALALYEEALRREPDLGLAMVGIAAQLITARNNYLAAPKPDLARAEALLRRAIQLDPEAERAYYWLGHLQMARAEYDQALTSFQRAVALNPSFAPALANAGHALVRLGRAREGLDDIERALSLEPKGPVARFGARFAGEAELELGHYQAAIEWLNRSVALDPDNPVGHALLAATYALLASDTKASEEAARFTALASPALLADLMTVGVDSADQAREQPSHFSQGLRLALSARP
jgi:DNA-binding SARP family transcriptional activator/TolB-like protein